MIDRIVIDPKIHHGKPVIRGTRVPAAIVAGSVIGGMSVADICKEYDLQPKDVEAALLYWIGQVRKQNKRTVKS